MACRSRTTTAIAVRAKSITFSSRQPEESKPSLPVRRPALTQPLALAASTGRDGEPNPAMVIADVVSTADSESPIHAIPSTAGPAVYKPVSAETIARLEANRPDFTVVFTEDKNGFYINGKKFAMD